MRIGIFARRLAPYTVSFLRALAARGHALELVYEAAEGEAPFAGFDLQCCRSAVAGTADGAAHRAWLARPDAELPDALWIAGWTHPMERAAGRRLTALGRPVVCGIDNPWRGTAKQWLGCLAAPCLLRPMARGAWVAGAPQAAFARRLGYAAIETGLYCADVEAYRCTTPLARRRPQFLFTGRLVADKGVDLLLAAYRRYRQSVTAPLELHLAGTGPMAALAKGEAGVTLRGFVQPSDLPALMAESQALVLPSRVENWGVVIHEAAAAGLPVLASARCGAASAYLRHGDTGFEFEPDAAAVLDALLRFHALTKEARQAMSNAGTALAMRFTPALQAERFERLLLRSAT